MRSVNEEGRLRIVEMMWELVYADGQVSEFEDNVVWRAADLLGVSSRDRIDLKHRVRPAATSDGDLIRSRSRQLIAVRLTAGHAAQGAVRWPTNCPNTAGTAMTKL